ncbi:MAG: DUF4234 domain-containing protein [Lachnospiraceae bacterium]|nr:DUF4234 domain-containing protein [Lachnospiraceae bacterium]
MFCTNCGSSVEDNAKFCPNCGAPIEGAAGVAASQPVADTYSQPELVSDGYGQAASDGYGQAQPGAGAYGQPASDGYSQPQPGAGAYGQAATDGYGQAQPGAGAYGQPVAYQQPQPAFSGMQGGATNRSIPLCIVLCFVTCGIYGIIWMIKLNDELNAQAGDTEAASGGLVFLFTLISCGIYALYWYYQMGRKVDMIKQGTGRGDSGNTPVLFLVLGLVGLGIVNYALMQSALNDVAG